ncbi:hypothetical protein CTS44_06344 [Comamonas thiooxydans]|nr:hypothetical protein CTS44_06344 [Comamonas thiooxydans]
MAESPGGSDLSFVNESMGCHKGVNLGGASFQKMGSGEPCKIDNLAKAALPPRVMTMVFEPASSP